MISQTKNAVNALKRAGLNHRKTKNQWPDFRVRTKCNSHGEYGNAQISIYNVKKALKLINELLENGFNVTRIIYIDLKPTIIVKPSYIYINDYKTLVTKLVEWRPEETNYSNKFKTIRTHYKDEK